MKRRTLLGGLGILGLGSSSLLTRGDQNSDHQCKNVTGNNSSLVDVQGIPLRDRAAVKKLIYGAAATRSKLSSDAKFADCFTRECGILVPEVELKWDVLRPNIDRFNFAPGNWLFEFTHTHKMLMRGHTLVWHDALPPWFPELVNRNNAEQILLKHIQTVVRHYAGKLHSWDVVNEAISPQDKRPDGLRNSPWLKLLGPDYIDLAFHAASAADPNALLVYNDYGLDYDTHNGQTRRAAVLNLLENLQAKGTPIHALGIQAHLYRYDTPCLNPEKLQKFLRQVASMGLKILITELDVTDKTLPKDLQVRDRMVAGIYEDYLNAVLEEPAVIAVLTWGLSDRYTWLANPDGVPARPLPLDSQFQRKLAWNAIARAFDRAPKRELQT
jgi:endo-1,4-beta-xylanase